MGVAGWGSDKPRLWSDDEGVVFNATELTALHWLHVPFDPEVLLFQPGRPGKLIDNPEEVARDAGLEIPIIEAFRLAEDPMQSWVLDSAFKKRDALFVESQKDPAVCAAIQGCVTGGVCSGVCETPEVAAPNLPPRDCPDNWTDIGADDETFCFPDAWLSRGSIAAPDPQRDCSAGLVDRGGGCEALTPCTSDRFRPIEDDLSSAVFVDATAEPSGDGSRTSPFRTIDEALATSRTPILLAPGAYTPTTELMNGRDIVGACPATTFINAGLTLSDGQLRLRGVSVAGRTAIHQTGGSLKLEDTVLNGSEWGLVQLGGTATATSTLFRVEPPITEGAALDNTQQSSFRGLDAHFVGGARARGASFQLANGSVSRRAPDGGFVMQFRDGVDATLGNVEVFAGAGLPVYVGQGASLTATKFRVVSEVTLGLVLAEGGTANLNEVVVLLRQPHPEVPRPAAVSVADSQLRLTNFASANFSKGLVVYGGDPRTQAPPPHVAELHLNRAWIRFDHDTAILGRHNVAAVSVTDAFVSGKEVPDPLFARTVPDSVDNSVLSFRAGTIDVQRTWLRPRGRHAIYGGTFVLLNLDDMFVEGAQGYTLYFRAGVRALVNRVSALGGSGGLYMQRFLDGTTPLHDDPREAIIQDLDLVIDDAETQRLGFPALFGGGVPTRIERFKIRGPLSVDPDVLPGTYRLTQGTLTYPGGDVWPDNFIDGFDQVSIR